MGERRRTYRVLVEKLKKNTQLKNIDIDGRIILEMISKISVERASTGQIWFRIKANYGFL